MENNHQGTSAPQEKPGFGQRIARSWNGFCRFIYKSETGQIMDRLPLEWMQLLGYFLIFYILLAAFFYLNLRGFMLMLHTQQPSLTGTDNLLRLQPGMGFRPQPDPEWTLIYFSKGQKTTDKVNKLVGYDNYTDDLNKFFKDYRYDQGAQKERVSNGKLINCTNTMHADYNYSCMFDLKSLGPVCAPPWVEFGNITGRSKTYGYEEGTPCVLLKMNRVYGWIPQFNSTLNNSITSITDWSNLSPLGPNPEQWGVRVECTGEHAADTDIMNSSYVAYKWFPNDKFSPLFYPFLNQEGYVSPVVMIEFTKLPLNSMLMIECLLKGHGINYYDKNEKMAAVHFEIMVHTPPGRASNTTAA